MSAPLKLLALSLSLAAFTTANPQNPLPDLLEGSQQPPKAVPNPFRHDSPFPQATGLPNPLLQAQPAQPYLVQPLEPLGLAAGKPGTPTRPQESAWTPPAEWGPKGKPFGPLMARGPPAPRITPGPDPPKEPRLPGGVRPPLTIPRPEYCKNPDLICTTLQEQEPEPVPFKVTCGDRLYLEEDVRNALTAGCSYARQGRKVGGSDYPKPFVNPGFDFGPRGEGKLYEMPIIIGAPYAGGQPGVDRAIISLPECYLAGELTLETGKYTACTEEY